ncbi:hypothetical protein WAF17_16450 [Bernardetia sp. ABR2-2B]|uniref:hypothetical protein n=1 Tax=Bernardetia sp. ABR2-2B TaxID=3127472 RepID=UPI0030CA7D09
MLYFNQIASKRDYNSILLDGVNDYFSCNVDTLNTTSPFSFFTRIEITDRSESTAVSTLTASGRTGFYFFTGLNVFGFPADHIVFTVYAGNYRGGISTFLPLNTPVNLHLVSDGGGADISNFKIYVDGVEASVIRNGFIPSVTLPSLISSRTFTDSSSLGRYFTGKIYNQSLVNYTKTLLEIESDNNNNKQSLDLLKGNYMYNIEFDKPPSTTTFQTEESNPKTVTIYR